MVGNLLWIIIIFAFSFFLKFLFQFKVKMSADQYKFWKWNAWDDPLLDYYDYGDDFLDSADTDSYSYDDDVPRISNQRKKEAHALKLLELLNKDRKEKKAFTDGVLESDGRSFPVHKCVVGAMSQYFEKMFCNEISEQQGNVVKVSGLKAERLDQILDYVYSGEVEITEDNVCETIEAANYVQLDGLKSDCIITMLQLVNEDNCFVFRAYAKLYDLSEVLENCNKVICECFDYLVEEEDLKQLEFSDVFAIMKENQTEVSHDSLLLCCENWIKHDLEARKDHFSELFDLVHLDELSDDFLEEKLSDDFLEEELDSKDGLHLLHPDYEAKLREELEKREAAVSAKACENHKQLNYITIGGLDSPASCWKVDARTNLRIKLPDLLEWRWSAAAVKDDNKVIVFGGENSRQPALNKVEMLDLSKPDQWSTLPPMKCNRKLAACAIFEGNYVVSGGSSPPRRALMNTCEAFDPETQRWTQHSALKCARHSHAMVTLGETLYVFGGWNKGRTKEVERFDQAKRQWVPAAPMLKERSGHSAAVLDDKIYAIGGSGWDDCNSVESYLKETDQWTMISPLIVGRFQSCAFVAEGKIFVVGGRSSPREKHSDKSFEAFDPSSKKWAMVGCTSTSRLMTVVGV